MLQHVPRLEGAAGGVIFLEGCHQLWGGFGIFLSCIYYIYTQTHLLSYCVGEYHFWGVFSKLLGFKGMSPGDSLKLWKQMITPKHPCLHHLPKFAPCIVPMCSFEGFYHHWWCQKGWRELVVAMFHHIPMPYAGPRGATKRVSDWRFFWLAWSHRAISGNLPNSSYEM